jgi:hypothetical protein
LLGKFNDRVFDFKAREMLIRIFSRPLSADINATPTNCEIEFGKFQGDLTTEENSDTPVASYSKYECFPALNPQIRK